MDADPTTYKPGNCDTEVYMAHEARMQAREEADAARERFGHAQLPELADNERRVCVPIEVQMHDPMDEPDMNGINSRKAIVQFSVDIEWRDFGIQSIDMAIAKYPQTWRFAFRRWNVVTDKYDDGATFVKFCPTQLEVCKLRGDGYWIDHVEIELDEHRQFKCGTLYVVAPDGEAMG